MDEVINYPARLMAMAETDSLNGPDLVGAARLIRRLAAEVERLYPKEITLDEAVEIINDRSYKGWSKWFFCDGLVEGPCRYSQFTEFEAIAIAEKLLRDRGTISEQ